MCPRPFNGYTEICYVRLTPENDQWLDKKVSRVQKIDDKYSKSKLINEMLERRRLRKKKKVA